jgi:hypothetical protein
MSQSGSTHRLLIIPSEVAKREIKIIVIPNFLSLPRTHTSFTPSNMHVPTHTPKHSSLSRTSIQEQNNNISTDREKRTEHHITCLVLKDPPSKVYKYEHNHAKKLMVIKHDST